MLSQSKVNKYERQLLDLEKKQECFISHEETDQYIAEKTVRRDTKPPVWWIVVNE